MLFKNKLRGTFIACFIMNFFGYIFSDKGISNNGEKFEN